MSRYTNQGLFNNYGVQFLGGSDVYVYIDNLYIKEIIGIGYNVVDNRVPYFGYDSKYFDYVFEGRSYVSGNIIIGVHTPQMLYKILVSLGYSYNYSEDVKFNFSNNMYSSDETVLELLSTVNIDDLDLDNDTDEGEFVLGKNFDIDIYTKGQFKEYDHKITIKDVYLMGVQSNYSNEDGVFEVYSYIGREVVSKTL